MDVIQALKRAVETAECPPGSNLLQRRFAELIGIPKSTANDWFHGQLAEPIKRFLCGLERLTDCERSDLFHEFLRPCPRLEGLAIANNPSALFALRALLEQKTGISFITGSDAARTYLVTAMGNSVAWRARVSGLDIHRPDRFVPVPGVFYVMDPCTSAQLRCLFRKIWSNLVDSGASVLILNGIWTILPEVRSKVARLAAKRHVLVSDPPGLDLHRTDWRIPLNVISIGSSTSDVAKLHVAIESHR